MAMASRSWPLIWPYRGRLSRLSRLGCVPASSTSRCPSSSTNQDVAPMSESGFRLMIRMRRPKRSDRVTESWRGGVVACPLPLLQHSDIPPLRFSFAFPAHHFLHQPLHQFRLITIMRVPEGRLELLDVGLDELDLFIADYRGVFLLGALNLHRKILEVRRIPGGRFHLLAFVVSDHHFIFHAGVAVNGLLAYRRLFDLGHLDRRLGLFRGKGHGQQTLLIGVDDVN